MSLVTEVYTKNCHGSRLDVNKTEYNWNYWKTTLTVTDIVKAVRLESSYLFRLFKNATGMPISSYLTAFRVQRACELMKTSGLSIKSVAFSVGLGTNCISPNSKKQRHILQRNI